MLGQVGPQHWSLCPPVPRQGGKDRRPPWPHSALGWGLTATGCGGLAGLLASGVEKTCQPWRERGSASWGLVTEAAQSSLWAPCQRWGSTDWQQRRVPALAALCTGCRHWASASASLCLAS